MERVYRRSCGMDIHQDTVVVCVLPPVGGEGEPIRKMRKESKVEHRPLAAIILCCPNAVASLRQCVRSPPRVDTGHPWAGRNSLLASRNRLYSIAGSRLEPRYNGSWHGFSAGFHAKLEWFALDSHGGQRHTDDGVGTIWQDKRHG